MGEFSKEVLMVINMTLNVFNFVVFRHLASPGMVIMCMHTLGT